MKADERLLFNEFTDQMVGKIADNAEEKGGFLEWEQSDLNLQLIKHLTRWVNGKRNDEYTDTNLLNIANLAFMVWAKRRVANA